MEIQQLDGAADLSAARDALEGHRWREAFDLLTQADREERLGASDLEALTQAVWFTAQPDLAVEARERAFKAYVADGNKARAAKIAFELSREFVSKRKFSIAAAWAARGERMLEGEPEGFAHGYQALSKSLTAEHAGDVETAIKFAGQAVEIGTRFSDADIRAWGLLQQGQLLIAGGRTHDGFPLLEEATIAAVNGELTPFIAGVAYCSMIASCRDTTDYRRASEWTEATSRWCERQSISGFPGICRVHRAEIVALQGALDRAEQELLKATTELAAYDATPPLADGFYALGEIRFRLGDLAGAEDALRQAHSLGRIPQPTLALMRLSEGKITAAYGAIRSALAGTDDRWARARMLPAQVEIAIAAGDPATARASAEELGEISAAYDSPALLASKHDSSGRVLLAEGDSGWHDDALRAVFVGNGGEVVNSTGDGFFVAFDSASSAITCAMAVQRALAEQRRTHGFAPAVRIGLHSAVATRRGSDYSGKDVHVAARIAALAGGGEIMASSATAAMAGSYPATETRVVSLKGVSTDVEVVSITWN